MSYWSSCKAFYSWVKSCRHTITRVNIVRIDGATFIEGNRIDLPNLRCFASSLPIKNAQSFLERHQALSHVRITILDERFTMPGNSIVAGIVKLGAGIYDLSELTPSVKIGTKYDDYPAYILLGEHSDADIICAKVIETEWPSGCEANILITSKKGGEAEQRFASREDYEAEHGKKMIPHICRNLAS